MNEGGMKKEDGKTEEEMGKKEVGSWRLKRLKSDLVGKVVCGSQ